MDLKLLYKSDNYHLSVRDVYASAYVCVLGGGGGVLDRGSGAGRGGGALRVYFVRSMG